MHGAALGGRPAGLRVRSHTSSRARPRALVRAEPAIRRSHTSSRARPRALAPPRAACAASDRAIASAAAYVLSAASLSRPAVRSDDIL